MAIAVGEPIVLRDALSNVESGIGVGSTLYLYDSRDNMTAYTIIHVDTGNKAAVLMRKAAAPSKSIYRPNIFSQDHDGRVYDGSNIDTYLTGTFHNAIPYAFKQILQNRTIQFLDLVNKGGWVSLPRTLNRKVFAPSAKELGITDSNAVAEGSIDSGKDTYDNTVSTFDYFRSSATLKRQIQSNPSGGSCQYWTRTRDKSAVWTDAGNINQAISIKSSGSPEWKAKSTELFVAVCINIRTDVIVSKTDAGYWWISPDLPPNKIASGVQSFAVTNDETVTITWPAATDTFNPTLASFYPSTSVYNSKPSDQVKANAKYNDIVGGVGYVVKEILHTGTGDSISEYYVADLTEYETSYAYSQKVYRAEYFVKTVDQWGNYSDFVQVANVSVTNNAPPYTPGMITYVGGKRNEKVTIAWEVSYDSQNRLDPDDNFRGYNVYRQINGVGELQLISECQRENKFSEISGDWDSVRYYVSAVDQNNAESDRTSVLIPLTSRVTVQLSVDSGSEIQATEAETNAPTVTTGAEDVDHSITFQITETDTDKSEHDYTVDAIAEGITSTPMIVAGDDDVTSGGTLVLSIPREQWIQIPNGTHRIRVDVKDNDDQDNQLTKTFFFKKSCTTAVLEISGDNAIFLDNPDITNVAQYMLQIDGEFPTGSSLSVQVSRNADEADPQDIEWETATIDGTFVSFSSTAQGAAMGIRVTLNRGTATDPCYIKSMHGMFGNNWFKWVESVLRDNGLIT